MDILLACLLAAAFVGAALALPLPNLRRPAAALLLVAAVAAVAAGLFGPADRTLTTIHTYAGYEGSNQEISMVAFPTGTRSAPGWQWPLPFAGFAALWAVVLLGLRDRALRNPFLLPLPMAWTAVAAWLAMQWLAAPAAVVQPLGIDRMLFPAGLALALLAARSARSLVGMFLAISSGTMIARVPVAFASKYLSDHRLGTALDIHTIRDIVNPMTQQQFDPRLTLDSGEQQFWLIWLEHVIVFPALYLLSFTGVAFGVYMFHKHGGEEKGPRLVT